MVYTVLLISEVVLSAALITLILMQHGKGADAGAAFGSGASGTVFGARGAANFLSRTTAILATAFFINCLALAYIVAHREQATSIIDKIETTSEPVAPAREAPVAGENSDQPAAADQPENGVSAPGDIPEAPVAEGKASSGETPKDIPE